MKWARCLLLPSSMAIFASVGYHTAKAEEHSVSLERQAELVHLVRQDCGSCHGMTLKGGLGRSLLPADLADREIAALASIIEDGLPGTPMPPWRGLITEGEAYWIAAKLKEGFPQ